MIGVIAREHEFAAAREFFQQFKTPWEFWHPERVYEVVLCTHDEALSGIHSKLILLYSKERLRSDPADASRIRTHEHPLCLSYNTDRIPIYRGCVTFPTIERDRRATAGSDHSFISLCKRNVGGQIIRVGYDLFGEIEFLLKAGQPIENALLPTIELHIEILRDQLRVAGIPFIEIPPVPFGYRFAVCLTHDIDHPSMRKHRSDHTAAGFLFRASIGSLSKFIRRSISFRSLLINLGAAVKWPFVQMGLARDPWADFYRTYQEVEKGLPCTYFVIPFAGKSGNTRNGPAPKHRASGYGAIDLRSAIHEISEMGNELGLHGIDAWIDSQSAQKELAEIQRLTGATRAGVRMHWLYFDEQSPRQLELAGVNYDSTVGYRETIGFRAGALQPYVHLSTEALLELPLHAMDTALFYPAYLGLKASEACKLLESIVDNAARFGGCLTINWHDRSLSPERQWDVAYRDFLLLLKRSGAWFTTASEATAWFHARRAFTFVEQKDDYSNTSYSNLSSGPGLPPMTIRKHSPASEAVVPSYLT